MLEGDAVATTSEAGEVDTHRSKARASRRPPGRRDELLGAALEVVRRAGAGASMDQMAAEAGITKPVLYRYFGDRDGLIAAMADRFSEDLVARLDAAFAAADNDDVGALIRAAIDGYLSFIEDDPALYGFLIHSAPLGSEAVVAVFDRVARSVARVMAEVFETLGLDKRPIITWAYGVVGTVHLAGARWVRRPDASRDELVGDLVALVSLGLTGAPVALRAP